MWHIFVILGDYLVSRSTTDVPDGFQALQPSILTVKQNMALTILPPYSSTIGLGYILPLDKGITNFTMTLYRCYSDSWEYIEDEFQDATFDTYDMVKFKSNVKPSWLFNFDEELYDFSFFDCDESDYFNEFHFITTEKFTSIFTLSAGLGGFKLYFNRETSAEQNMFVPLIDKSTPSEGEVIAESRHMACAAATSRGNTENTVKNTKSNNAIMYIVIGLIIFFAIIIPIIFFAFKKCMSHENEKTAQTEQELNNDNGNCEIYEEITLNYSSNYDAIQDVKIEKDKYEKPEREEKTTRSYLALNESANTREISYSGYLPMGFGRPQAPNVTRDEVEHVTTEKNEGIIKYKKYRNLPCKCHPTTFAHPLASTTGALSGVLTLDTLSKQKLFSTIFIEDIRRC